MKLRFHILYISTLALREWWILCCSRLYDGQPLKLRLGGPADQFEQTQEGVPRQFIQNRIEKVNLTQNVGFGLG